MGNNKTSHCNSVEPDIVALFRGTRYYVAGTFYLREKIGEREKWIIFPVFSHLFRFPHILSVPCLSPSMIPYLNFEVYLYRLEFGFSHTNNQKLSQKKKEEFFERQKKKKKKKSEIWRRQRWEIIEDCDLRSSRGVHSVLLGFLWGISISHFGWFEKFLWLVGIIFCFSLNLIFINMFLEKTWPKKRNFTLDFEQWSRIK